jgi:SAM-dependent methyltransferase
VGRWVVNAIRSLVYRAPLERQTCTACDSPRVSHLDVLTLQRPIDGRRTGFISVCDGCGLVFANPQPSAEEQERFYSPAGEWGRHRAHEGGLEAQHTEPVRVEGFDEPPRVGGSWTKLFDPAGAALSVAAPPPGARVLDFGCGPGSLLDSLQDCGWETFGIEPAFDAAFRRHQRLHVVPETPTFDLIVANHVLEHLSNPLRLLRQLAAAARPEGYLLVGAPRLDTLPIHRDYKYVINGRAHVTAYTWDCLRELLRRAGWAPVAPPPDRISKGGGRMTSSRLRVLSRRTDAAGDAVPEPGRSARDAIRRFHANDPTRSFFERSEWLRVAARRAEARRRREATAQRAVRREAAAERDVKQP